MGVTFKPFPTDNNSLLNTQKNNTAPHQSSALWSLSVTSPSPAHPSQATEASGLKRPFGALHSKRDTDKWEFA